MDSDSTCTPKTMPSDENSELILKVENNFNYNIDFKGTVRLDWISLRVISLDRP